MSLSIEGLRERDAFVLRECYEREVPIVTVMSGGYGKEELERAGAYRVYEDPLDLLAHLDEVGVR